MRLRVHIGRLLACLVAIWTCACTVPESPLPTAPPTGPAAPAPAATPSVTAAPPSTSEFRRAREHLAQNYREFLEREEMRFGPETLEKVVPALAAAFERATGAMDFTDSASVRTALPLVIVGLFLLALAVFDRQSWRLASRAHARAHSIAWEWLKIWLRITAVLLGRTAPVALLVALSYFPIQALFGRAMWTHSLTTLLWLLLGYRALMAWTTAAFAFELFDVADRHARRLEAFGRRMSRLVFGLLGVVAIADQLRVANDVRALVVFVYELAVLAVPIYLLFIKSSVLAMLPEPEGGLWPRLHKLIGRYYRALILWSAFLLALRAVGYVHASTFILVRGYGLLLMIVLAVAGGVRLRRWLHEREAGSEEHRQLIKSIEWASRVVSLLVVTYAGLRLLDVWGPLVIILEIPLVALGEATISAFSIINAALFLLAAVLLARFVRAILVLRVFPAFDVDVGVGYAVQTLVHYALILVGFFVALVALGVNLSAMTVVLASLGVGIGFGLQTITENLISGFILLFGRSVKKGDIVTVGETYGQVQAVGARSVLIHTPDNYDLLIPSKEIVGGRIVNWSYSDTIIRLHIPVGVTYKCNPRDVERVLLEAAKLHSSVLPEPAPEVWLTGFGDSSVDFALLVYFDCVAITRDRLKGQLYFLIWDALHEAGIEIPFPQRDLHLRSVEVPEDLRRLTR